MTSINAGMISAITVGVGLFAVILKMTIRGLLKKPAFVVAKCANDLLNGAMAIPFLLMVAGAFSTTVSEYLRSASPEYTALAEAVGFFFLLGELIKL
jgi:hypothetical protein